MTTFIKNELKAIQQSTEACWIRALEAPLQTTFHVDVNGAKTTVTLKGIADRIDVWGNTLRVIDYKTGLTMPNDLKIGSMEELVQPHKKNTAFQVLMYAYMYAKENQLGATDLLSGIVSFRKLSNGLMLFMFNKETAIQQELLLEVEQLLQQIIVELLDDSISFQHQPAALYCEFCG